MIKDDVKRILDAYLLNKFLPWFSDLFIKNVIWISVDNKEGIELDDSYNLVSTLRARLDVANLSPPSVSLQSVEASQEDKEKNAQYEITLYSLLRASYKTTLDENIAVVRDELMALFDNSHKSEIFECLIKSNYLFTAKMVAVLPKDASQLANLNALLKNLDKKGRTKKAIIKQFSDRLKQPDRYLRASQALDALREYECYFVSNILFVLDHYQHADDLIAVIHASKNYIENVKYDFILADYFSEPEQLSRICQEILALNSCLSLCSQWSWLVKQFLYTAIVRNPGHCMPIIRIAQFQEKNTDAHSSKSRHALWIPIECLNLFVSKGFNVVNVVQFLFYVLWLPQKKYDDFIFKFYSIIRVSPQYRDSMGRGTPYFVQDTITWLGNTQLYTLFCEPERLISVVDEVYECHRMRFVRCVDGFRIEDGDYINSISEEVYKVQKTWALALELLNCGLYSFKIISKIEKICNEVDKDCRDDIILIIQDYKLKVKKVNIEDLFFHLRAFFSVMMWFKPCPLTLEQMKFIFGNFSQMVEIGSFFICQYQDETFNKFSQEYKYCHDFWLTYKGSSEDFSQAFLLLESSGLMEKYAELLLNSYSSFVSPRPTLCSVVSGLVNLHDSGMLVKYESLVLQNLQCAEFLFTDVCSLSNREILFREYVELMVAAYPSRCVHVLTVVHADTGNPNSEREIARKKLILINALGTTDMLRPSVLNTLKSVPWKSVDERFVLNLTMFLQVGLLTNQSLAVLCAHPELANAFMSAAIVWRENSRESNGNLDLALIWLEEKNLLSLIWSDPAQGDILILALARYYSATGSVTNDEQLLVIRHNLKYTKQIVDAYIILHANKIPADVRTLCFRQSAMTTAVGAGNKSSLPVAHWRHIEAKAKIIVLLYSNRLLCFYERILNLNNELPYLADLMMIFHGRRISFSRELIKSILNKIDDIVLIRHIIYDLAESYQKALNYFNKLSHMAVEWGDRIFSVGGDFYITNKKMNLNQIPEKLKDEAKLLRDCQTLLLSTLFKCMRNDPVNYVNHETLSLKTYEGCLRVRELCWTTWILWKCTGQTLPMELWFMIAACIEHPKPKFIIDYASTRLARIFKTLECYQNSIEQQTTVVEVVSNELQGNKLTSSLAS